MSDVQAAQGIRLRIEQSGGPLQMPARQLRDAFGRTRLTERAGREIEQALREAGLAVEPSIRVVDADELVTVRLAERQVAAGPAPSSESVPRAAWSQYRRLPAWLQLLTPIVLVLIIAGVAGGGESSKTPEQHAQQAGSPTTTTSIPADKSAERRRAARQRAAARRAARRAAAAQRAREERQAERERAAEARRRARRRQREREQQVIPPGDDSGGSGSGCDPNYTGACVPTDQGDVDCPDIAETDFNSVGSDPDRLDADHDGIACES